MCELNVFSIVRWRRRRDVRTENDSQNHTETVEVLDSFDYTARCLYKDQQQKGLDWGTDNIKDGILTRISEKHCYDCFKALEHVFWN